MGGYQAATAAFTKIRADNAMSTYAQHVRELLDLRVLNAISWIDTRDMCADGSTQGSVDRQLLHEVMACVSSCLHPLHLWQPKGLMNNTDLAIC